MGERGMGFEGREGVRREGEGGIRREGEGAEFTFVSSISRAREVGERGGQIAVDMVRSGVN